MAAVKNILMVQLYSNGDCLYATAIAKQIKVDYPGCRLTWAIASFCKNIILHNPDVDVIMEINNVAKNDVGALRRLKKEVAIRKNKGEFDEIFFVHNGDTNQAYYDGCIRSSILNAYPKPITVSLTPVLRLTETEKLNAVLFAERFNLKKYKTVILFEYAPQSGQSNMTQKNAISIAEKLSSKLDAAIILSSAEKVQSINDAIIDGSVLTLRETAALTHYCNFLLGSSSGITWISTADAAKQLPMVQLLNPAAVWINPLSRDFERFNFSRELLIELMDYDENCIVDCVCTAVTNFPLAKEKYNQPVPLNFKTTRNIVYNLLCYGELKSIATHIAVNKKIYGYHPDFYKAIILGVLTFPFKLASNFIEKKRVKNKRVS